MLFFNNVLKTCHGFKPLRSPGTLCERLRQNHKHCWELQIPLLLNISLHLQSRQDYQQQRYYTSWFPEETQHFFWPLHVLGTKTPSLQGTRCRDTWSCIVATALYIPRSVKQERPSGPAEIAHLFFLAKRLSVLSCCIRIAAGCRAIGRDLLPLPTKAQRAELHWAFTFTWTQQTHVKHSAPKPILPKHVRVEVCSVPWTNSTSSFTWFFFSSLAVIFAYHLYLSLSRSTVTSELFLFSVAKHWY